MKPEAHNALPTVQSGDLWPCPPPLRWRRWTGDAAPSSRRRRRNRLHQTTNSLMRRIVPTLNWLALGYPLKPSVGCCAGAPCSAEQASMLDELEGLVRHFVSAGPFDSSQLGRCESKFIELVRIAQGLPSASVSDSELESLPGPCQPSSCPMGGVIVLSRLPQPLHRQSAEHLPQRVKPKQHREALPSKPPMMVRRGLGGSQLPQHRAFFCFKTATQ